MKKVMDILMLSCNKASALIDKKSIFGLSIIEKIQLAMHTSMCETCKAYKKQSEFLDEAIKDFIQSKSPSEKPDKTLSEATKQEIIKSLRNK